MVRPCWALTVGGLLSLTRSLLPDSEQEGRKKERYCACVSMVFVRRLAPGRTAARRRGGERRLLGNVRVTGVTQAGQIHTAAVTDTFLARDNLQMQPPLSSLFQSSLSTSCPCLSLLLLDLRHSFCPLQCFLSHFGARIFLFQHAGGRTENSNFSPL